MTEFEIDGVAYAASKMSADAQFKVMKRLLPLIANYDVLREALPLAIKSILGPEDGAEAVDDDKPQSKADIMDMLAKCLGGLATSIAALKDDDLDYIRAACLSLVKRQDGASWAPIWNKSGGLQYQDINALVQMRVIAHVVLEEFKGFFPSGALSSLAARQT